MTDRLQVAMKIPSNVVWSSSVLPFIMAMFHSFATSVQRGAEFAETMFMTLLDEIEALRNANDTLTTQNQDLRDQVRTLNKQLAGPECGTDGCIAGWVGVLATPTAKLAQFDADVRAAVQRQQDMGVTIRSGGFGIVFGTWPTKYSDPANPRICPLSALIIDKGLRTAPGRATQCVGEAYEVDPLFPWAFTLGFDGSPNERPDWAASSEWYEAGRKLREDLKL